jgi:hypothetical protein
MPVAILAYIILNESLNYFLTDITQLMILDISSILLLILLWIKDEHIN